MQEDRSRRSGVNLTMPPNERSDLSSLGSAFLFDRAIIGFTARRPADTFFAEASRLLVSEVPKTMDPPTIAQKPGRSPVASVTQRGFKIGSMMLMMDESRARTCRIARE